MNEARKYWNEAINRDNSFLTAKINLANSYRDENPDMAIAELLKLKTEAQQEPLLWYNLAWLYFNKNDFAVALEYAKNADVLECNDTIKYLLGLCYLQINDEQSAFAAFEQSEKINNHNFNAMLCLADIYSKNSIFSEAEKRYKKIIDNNPKDFAAHANYAEMLYRQKRNVEAMEEYRKAVINNPKSAELSNNLGAVLKDMGELDEALGLFFNALSLNPQLNEISVNIWETLVLLSEKDEEKAIKIADNWQKNYPDNHFAKYAKSVMEGKNAESCEVFIEKLFDSFADNYELVMQNLDYSAPLAIRRIAGDLEGRIADLGCGSGFVAENIKNDKNYIIGVDLSAKMLELAAGKKVYGELIKSDVINFLQTRSDFETVVAADVLGYISDVDVLIRLCKGKKLIFTIETTGEDDKYIIKKTGRIKHNPVYIDNLLKINGYKNIYKESVNLRRENDEFVDGMVYMAN